MSWIMLAKLKKYPSQALLLTRVVIVLTLTTNIILGQDGRLTKLDENGISFLQKLLNSSPEEQETLLKTQPDRLNPKLWNDLSSRALFDLYRQGISESSRTYFAALKVAELLGNDQLVAQTWYH